MKEILLEVYSSISKHKLRSFLTGLGVAWGMFILIILLGVGSGFKMGILNMFQGYASNSIWITGNWISEATAGGLQAGTHVKFDRFLIRRLQNVFHQIKQISTEITLSDPVTIKYLQNSSFFSVKGIQENYLNMKLLDIDYGRFFNKKDFEENRRIAIIGKRVKEVLFENQEPVGKYIDISGVFFRVVGVLKEGTMFSIMEQNNIYIPSETLCCIFGLADECFTFGVLLDKKISALDFEKDLRSFVCKEIGLSENDKNALYVNNIQLQVKAFDSLFDGINNFLWILGSCFLLSGVIGITNIMLVVVKERTNEIGIRKAIGATPNSIIHLIMAETLAVTMFFGIIGMFMGYIGLNCYNWIISIFQSEQQEIFCKGMVEPHIAFIAFMVVVVFGVLAGVFPAKKASEIMPIETLNKVG